jgi:hypothetical protein
MHEEIAHAHVGAVQQRGRIELGMALERRELAIAPARGVDLFEHLLGQTLRERRGRQQGEQAEGEARAHGATGGELRLACRVRRSRTRDAAHVFSFA